MINRCRVCGDFLCDKPLLQYANMPKSAQYFVSDTRGDEGIELEIYQCSGCGLVQLRNEPVEYYREVIRASDVSDEMRAFRRIQFNEFVDKYDLGGKKVVEVGCGAGEYLSILNGLVEAYGLESGVESAMRCLDNKLKVQVGFIDRRNFKINGAPFRAFLLLGVLEHMPAPNTVLRGIASNLEAGAVGIVEVPNLDMMVRSRLFSEFMSDHLLYFTSDTLKLTMSINGFDVIDCEEIWHDYILSATVRKRKALDASPFDEQQKVVRRDIDSYVSQFRNGKVVMWGAGHQALAILSLMNLSERISCVIDSATFKQNKYTPATHIPIVSPKEIDKSRVDAVIVVAGSYSDEVAKQASDIFNRASIAVLRGNGLEVMR